MRSYTRTEDIYSDPDLLSTNYRIGRSAFFEASSSSGDFAESQSRGDVTGNPAAVASSGGGGGIGGDSGSGAGGSNPGDDFGGSTGGDDGGFHCPEISQYVWAENGPIKAGRLPKLVGKVKLLNPLTGNYNLLTYATIIPDQDLLTLVSVDGCVSVVSISHKIIRNTADRNGTTISLDRLGKEVLRFDHKTRNIYSDYLSQINLIEERGSVVTLSLEAEFIYVTGSNKKQGFLSHNRKNEEAFDALAL